MFFAVTILWFLVCWPTCKIPCTAPTSHQLEDLLWPEVAKWLRVLQGRYPTLGSTVEIVGDRVRRVGAPDAAFAVRRTARPEQPEALQGFHDDYILFLVDEASGVPDRVFEVAEGALSTPGAYIVLAGNPTRSAGYFYDSHHKDRAAWYPMHINGERCRRVAREYIERMAAKYGTHSQVYKVRVQGEFITGFDAVIPLELCEAAKIRQVAVIERAPVIWGVDVARFGDDSSALAKRKGNHQVGKVQERYGLDTMQTAGWVWSEYQAAAVKPVAINIDVIGIGAGVVDRLTELGAPVCGINVAEAESAPRAGAEREFNRLRDELWWRAREWLEAKDCVLADDDELIGELTTPKYTILSNGKTKVEGKDELKKRGVKSPNLADAWNLTFADTATSMPAMTRQLQYPSLGIA